MVLSGHWGTIFDHTSPFGTIRSLRYNIWSNSPFGTIRSLRYNIWSYLSIWYYQVTEVILTLQYQVTEVQYLTIPLHLLLSGHWGIIFDHTSPFGTIRSLRYNIWSYLSTRSLRYNIWPYLSICSIRSLRYNIWSYLSIWCYQVTEVQYLINTSPFVAIRSLRYNIWSYPSIWYYQVTEVQYLIIPLHLVLPGHWGTIFVHTSPFGTIRSEVQYLIIPLHLVLSGHWGTIFDHTSPFGAIRSLRYNIWHTSPFIIRSLRYNISYLSIWYYQVTEVQYLIIPLHFAIRSLRYNIWS